MTDATGTWRCSDAVAAAADAAKAGDHTKVKNDASLGMDMDAAKIGKRQITTNVFQPHPQELHICVTLMKYMHTFLY